MKLRSGSTFFARYAANTAQQCLFRVIDVLEILNPLYQGLFCVIHVLEILNPFEKGLLGATDFA